MAVSAAALSVGSAALSGDRSGAAPPPGRVVTDLGGDDAAAAVAIQPDGKILVAGVTGTTDEDSAFALARYTRDGRLDRGFGGDGRVRTDVGGRAHADAVGVLADGRILAVGHAIDSRAVAFARYLPNGRIDTSFGRRGKVVLTHGRYEYPYLMTFVVPPDGRVVGAGFDGPVIVAHDFLVVRYTRDGRPDPRFGRDGAVTTDFSGTGDESPGVVLQADGRIVAAGSWGEGRGIALARYTTAGRLDPGFGRNGKVTTPARAFPTRAASWRPPGADAVTTQRDGKLVVLGVTWSEEERESDFVLARYTAAGRLDRGFGAGGAVLTSFAGPSNDTPVAVVVQGDGRIVAVGSTGSWDGGSRMLALARYLPDGRLDPGFGGDGTVVTRFHAQAVSNGIGAVAVQADGRIVVVGTTALPGRARPGDFALARFLPDGRFDPSFGVRGAKR
jgi:uncharacterized delta-60 repeat protein